MATNTRFIVPLLLLYCSIGYPLQSSCIKQTYDAEIGVREATGNNDGERVELYLRSTSQSKGAAWCAAFVHWVLEQCQVPNTINAWSPTAHNKKNLVWYRRKMRKPPIPGDVFCLYYQHLKRIGHTGFYDLPVNEKVYQTVEGNTDGSGTNEGDGVYRRKRSFNATYSISRWSRE